MSKVFSISEINSYISEKINSDNNLINIKIKGEISNLTKHSVGHYYLTLKDKDSVLQCIIFKSNAAKLKFDITEGMNIICYGTLKGYVRGGGYSFWINEILESEEGDIHLKFEKLKKLYSEKGYFDKSIKKPIPMFPENIAIITAPTGAAIRDIISTINRRYKITNLYLFSSIVQGETAPSSISRNIKKVNNFIRDIDVIILGRGGGSFEDLSCFSEPEVIEEIYKSKIPIISAVGHEIDYQLSDFVADLRAETPTAAAERATPNTDEIKKFLNENLQIMFNAIMKKINNNKDILDIYKNNYHLKNLNWIYKEKELLIKNYYENIVKNFYNIYKLNIMNLNKNKKELELVNPKNILKRGYSIISSVDSGKIIKSVDNIKLEDNLKLIFLNNSINVKIKKIDEKVK